MTGAQADGLARVAFEHQVRHIKERGGYSLDPQRPSFDPRFARFEIIGVWGDPNEVLDSILGRFAVDRLTADVWDIYAECFRVDYPELRKAQQAYRQLYRLPDRRTVPPSKPRTC